MAKSKKAAKKGKLAKGKKLSKKQTLAVNAFLKF